MNLTITQSLKYPTQYTVADSTPLPPVEEQVYFSGFFGTHGPGVYAAGPELLHALLCLKEWVDDHAEKPAEISEMQTAIAAIALAKGDVK